MNPTSVSEQMMYCTTKIITSTGSGTGFFFSFNLEQQCIPVIITNKHVVNYKEKEKVKFCFHVGDQGNVTNENITATLDIDWYFHETQDICFCFLQPIITYIKDKTGKDVYFIRADESMIYKEKQLEELSALEDVTMIGYPIGLADEVNNFPIFRKGVTASHPYYNFNDKKIGLVDMACFPGSSGSPIFILNESGYRDKKGNIYMGASRVVLLGVLYAGPQYNTQGNLIVENIPTSQRILANTPTMINLGYYVKAEDILTLKKIIEKLLTPPIN